jgi:hypothetical protein
LRDDEQRLRWLAIDAAPDDSTRRDRAVDCNSMYTSVDVLPILVSKSARNN